MTIDAVQIDDYCTDEVFDQGVDYHEDGHVVHLDRYGSTEIAPELSSFVPAQKRASWVTPVKTAKNGSRC